MSERKQSDSMVNRFLSVIEKAGNALPHPTTLFLLFALGVILLSWVVSFFEISVINPSTGKVITAVNLLSVDGLHKILTEMVVNFTSFAPLGTVLVALLGIGIAEHSGLIGTGLRLLVTSAPKKLLTFIVVFAGVLSNTASEVGYVLLVPLAGMIFLAAGRHPITGIAAAFAGVSGGYSANLLLGTIDPLLAGLSQEASHIIDKAYTVNPAANYYFMAVSTFFIAIAGTWVTEKIIAPRFGSYDGEKAEEITKLTSQEKKGLTYATIVIALFIILILIGILPETGFLREVGTGSVLKSPLLSGIVAIIFLLAALAGLAYGIGAGTIKKDADAIKGMSKSMEQLGSYLVLVFFAAQFVAYFKWTNLGLIMAIEGSDLLKSAGLQDFPMALFLAFIVLTAIVNLIIGSASAKWAIMAPVFIPMFMLLGYSPELTQLAYRIGDSVTNIISPMMSYFALIIVFIQKYEPKAGIGTVITTMLPYSIVFFIIWSILMIIWLQLGIPIGPGAPLAYPPAL